MKFVWIFLIAASILAVWLGRDQEKNLPTPKESTDSAAKINKIIETEIPASIGGTSINIEIANTDEERAKGLSGREALPENTGLLFVFEKGGVYGIWMKDMKFSIDIAWLDQDKKIIHIEKNVSPSTYPKVFYPPSSAFYVLETNSGFFEASKVIVGDVAKF